MSEEQKALSEKDRFGEGRGYGLMNKVTTNMAHHLKKKHGIVSGDDEGQQKMDDFVEKEISDPVRTCLAPSLFNSSVLQMYTRERLLERVIRFLVNGNLPIRVVEHDDFINLIRFLRPQAAKDLIKADALGVRIREMLPIVKGKIRIVLQGVPHQISLTTDLWTSVTNVPYIGLTAHWINDKDLEKAPHFESLSIALTELPDRHTGERIADKLHLLLDAYGIFTKSLGLTGDNASNVDSAADFLWRKNPANAAKPQAEKTPHRIRCFTHILHLAVHAGLDAMKISSSEAVVSDEDEEDDDGESDLGDRDGAPFWAAFERLRGIIRLIKKSANAKEAYISFCKALGLDEVMPILDVRTRWNSVLESLDRAIQQRPALDAVAQKEKKPAVMEEDWAMFGIVVKMLRSFQVATKYMSEASMATLSLTLHIFNMLMDEMEDLNESATTPEFIKVAARASFDKLCEYYSKTDLEADAYMMALLLDPRFNMRSIRQWEDVLKDRYRALFIRIVKGYAAPEPDRMPLPKDPSLDPLSSFAARLAGDIESDEMDVDGNNLEDECRRYLDERRAKIDENPLLWWFQKRRDYSTIYKAAMDYLAVQGGSVASERMFSDAGSIHTKQRASMKAETLESIFLLKSWNGFEKRRLAGR